jgi:hypothetical protein
MCKSCRKKIDFNKFLDSKPKKLLVAPYTFRVLCEKKDDCEFKKKEKNLHFE